MYVWCTICVHVGSLDKLATVCPAIYPNLKLKFERDVAMMIKIMLEEKITTDSDSSLLLCIASYLSINVLLWYVNCCCVLKCLHCYSTCSVFKFSAVAKVKFDHGNLHVNIGSYKGQTLLPSSNFNSTRTIHRSTTWNGLKR